MTLDSILNVVIPFGIFIFLGILVYGKAKKPIDAFFKTVKGWFEKKDSEETERDETLNYKIDYRGAEY